MVAHGGGGGGGGGTRWWWWLVSLYGRDKIVGFDPVAGDDVPLNRPCHLAARRICFAGSCEDGGDGV